MSRDVLCQPEVFYKLFAEADAPVLTENQREHKACCFYCEDAAGRGRRDRYWSSQRGHKPLDREHTFTLQDDEG